MGVAIVLVGMFLALIGAPVQLIRTYRKELALARTEQERVPEARVVGMRGEVARSGATARRHRVALTTAIFRGLLPVWFLALALILAGSALV